MERQTSEPNEVPRSQRGGLSDDDQDAQVRATNGQAEATGHRAQAQQRRQHGQRRWAQAERRRHNARERWNQDHPLAARFADVGAQLLSADDIESVLSRIVTAAPAVIPDADLASVTVLRHGEFRTPVRTDPVAARLDEAQYQSGAGPCLDATRARGIGVSRHDDLAAPSTPWTGLADVAAQLGMHSVLAVGLFPNDRPPRLGALNLYARRPGALVEADTEAAVLLAAHLATALVALSQVRSERNRAEQLNQALDTQQAIDQATGILMERHGLSADEALKLMSDASHRLDVQLSELADDITAGRPLPPPT